MGMVVFVGNIEQSNNFEFMAIHEDKVYRAVYKDEYMQVIELMKDPTKKIKDNTLEKICEMVERWFAENENNARWNEK